MLESWLSSLKLARIAALSVARFGLGSAVNIHALSAARDSPTLLHAVKLAAAGILRLALHVVVVVVAAPGAVEEGRREQRRRAGAHFLDGRDIVGERRCVDEHLLMKPGSLVNSCCVSASPARIGCRPAPMGGAGHRSTGKKGEAYWGRRVAIVLVDRLAWLALLLLLSPSRSEVRVAEELLLLPTNVAINSSPIGPWNSREM